MNYAKAFALLLAAIFCIVLVWLVMDEAVRRSMIPDAPPERPDLPPTGTRINAWLHRDEFGHYGVESCGRPFDHPGHWHGEHFDIYCYGEGAP